MIIDKALIERLRNLIQDFENAVNDDTCEDYLSDGEWLDEFYNMACILSASAKEN